MFRKIAIATLATALIALTPTAASARFGGGGFHGGFGGGFRGAGIGFRGPGVGWRGGGWRGGGWGWGGPAIAAGIGLGIASAAAWGPGWGPGWGWGDPGWSYASYGGCTQWRRVWTGWGWRLAPVNVCW